MTTKIFSVVNTLVYTKTLGIKEYYIYVNYVN